MTYSLLVLLELEEILGIIIADIFNHLVYAFHLGDRNFTIFHITAYKIAQCTAEIFMTRIGEEGTGIGQHTNKSA